ADPGLSQSVRIGSTFDLDDLSAQIAEQPAELAAGDDDAQVDDPQPLERTRAGTAGGGDLGPLVEPPSMVVPNARCGSAEADVLTVDGVVAGRDAAAHARDEFGVGDGAHRLKMVGRQDLRRIQSGGDRYAMRLA